ncbi:MAG: class I SAM-dependent methyltransferase [Candidatus Melainabacteria bacterium]|nr:class I SAM-dependent methyltransferase [Candidatus Melainabacteria bacterium]
MNIGSSYEEYEKTHSNYDKTRLALGGEQIIRFLRAQFPDSTQQPHILDAGCGTGIHLHALKLAGFDLLTGLDASRTGLKKTREKLGSAVDLVCADIRRLPFAAQSFDVILFSFVLHHLPHKSEDELEKATQAVLQGAAEVLKPGGHLIIVTCTREQMSPEAGCIWYYKYFAEAAEKLASRFLQQETMLELLQTTASTVCIVPLETTYWRAANLDPQGPLQEDWRSGDSLFALCEKTPELFQKQLCKLKADIESGAVLTQIAIVKERTERIKQGVLLFATKSASTKAA